LIQPLPITAGFGPCHQQRAFGGIADGFPCAVRLGEVGIVAAEEHRREI
jgi:hypothetical protein